MLALHRRLLALRRETPALQGARGARRRAGTGRRVRPGRGRHPFRILLNLGSEPVEVSIAGTWRLALSTHLDRADEAAVGTPCRCAPTRDWSCARRDPRRLTPSGRHATLRRNGSTPRPVADPRPHRLDRPMRDV